MKTLEQITASLKQQYPVINVGSDEVGYTKLNATEYEATILDWANNYPPEPKTDAELESDAQAKVAAKAAAQAKLAALGLTTDDLKALGL